ncbi:MAG: TFIIB-type zinc ribbon-containing protein [Bacteroidaceae bacterium]|nr:TFIIB-type zinc ribbon-containing protein [Bacteroidaceae bacterium]
MDELICPECKGRKFRKISSLEYECEYCGAVIKDTSTQSTPKVFVIQQPTQPQPIVTPFPPEISYVAVLSTGFWDALEGKLIIYPDKFAFTPSSSFTNRLNGGNLSSREWRISDISGYVKGMWVLDIKMMDGTKIKLSVNNKKSIIDALEERRKYWIEK